MMLLPLKIFVERNSCFAILGISAGDAIELLADLCKHNRTASRTYGG